MLLYRLFCKPVNVDSTFRKEPHIILKELDNKVIGNGGCNAMSGSFEIRSMNRISFSKMIVTRMTCSNMDIESRFLKALEMTDNFNLVGDTLILNRAKMATLARFKTVYMN
jgi:heat shock protein HslJ